MRTLRWALSCLLVIFCKDRPNIDGGCARFKGHPGACRNLFDEYWWREDSWGL